MASTGATPGSGYQQSQAGNSSFDGVQAIFDARCAGSACHVGAVYPSDGLDLTAGASYANLVGVASTGDPTRLRVNPGHPESSYLVCKIDPMCASIVGDHMPVGAMLSSDEIADIEAWVSAGAAPGMDGTGSNTGSSCDGGACVPPQGGDTVPPTFAGVASAVPQGEAEISVSWAPATDDQSAASGITYRVYAGPTSGGEDYSVAAATVTGVTTATVTGLSAKHTYYFVVRAADQAGNEDTNHVEKSATTLDQTAPSFSGLSAAAATGSSSASLTWAAAADNVDPASSISYRVYVAASPGQENFSRPFFSTQPGATSASLSGLPAGTAYFIVRAVDTSGNEETNTVERSIVANDTTRPTFGGLTSATGGPNSVTLAWNAGSDDVTPAAQLVYLVYQASTPGGENLTSPVATTAPGATSFAVGGLSPNTTYYFVVRARDQAGNIDTNTVERSAKTPTTSDTTPPTFAGATGATSPSMSSAVVSWNAASDNVSSPSQLVYLVYQAAASGAENYAAPTYTTVAGAASYAVSGLTADTSYYFVVRARDQAGNVDTNTQEVTVKTQADTAPPTFAGASSASAQSSSSIAVSWSAASDNLTSSSQIVYLVYEAAGPGGENYASPTATTGAGATSFTAAGLSAGMTYYFVVRARDQAGNVDINTHEVSATTPSASGTVSFGSQIEPIFISTCVSNGCHGGVNPAEGLNLSTAAKAYAGLVGAASSECTATKRVQAGSPGASYLMWKLQGSGSCFSGSQMPKGGPALSATQMNLISSWISAGAPNN